MELLVLVEDNDDKRDFALLAFKQIKLPGCRVKFNQIPRSNAA